MAVAALSFLHRRGHDHKTADCGHGLFQGEIASNPDKLPPLNDEPGLGETHQLAIKEVLIVDGGVDVSGEDGFTGEDGADGDVDIAGGEAPSSTPLPPQAQFQHIVAVAATRATYVPKRPFSVPLFSPKNKGTRNRGSEAIFQCSSSTPLSQLVLPLSLRCPSVVTFSCM